MTLKFRLSLYTSIVFTLLFGAVSTIIILLFSDYRKQEFRERLEEKALTSIKLLIEVKEVDKQLLKVIDQNSINKLYNEKTLIFDANYNLIYSSLDDTQIGWTIEDLDFLKANKTFFKRNGDYEIYGVFYDTQDQDFYALISANDNYGKRKLQYLIYLLLGAYIIFSILAWSMAFYLVKSQLIPLDYFIKQMGNINENNLETRLVVKSESQNELDLIGKEFNYMMNRIEQAYQKQKEFTANASHELRTPITRIALQLENQIKQVSPKERYLLERIFMDINQLNDLINSLLLLSKVDNIHLASSETVRIDEVIFDSFEQVKQVYPDFIIHLNINAGNDFEQLLEVKGNQKLFETAFVNLLKNAYFYSDNKQATVDIGQHEQHLQVVIANSGPTLSPAEQGRIFQPFMRGENAKHRVGLGLGLRMVQRIFQAYRFAIRYEVVQNSNRFIVNF